MTVEDDILITQRPSVLDAVLAAFAARLSVKGPCRPHEQPHVSTFHIDFSGHQGGFTSNLSVDDREIVASKSHISELMAIKAHDAGEDMVEGILDDLAFALAVRHSRWWCLRVWFLMLPSRVRSRLTSLFRRSLPNA